MVENVEWLKLVSIDVPVSIAARDAADKGLLSADEAEGWILADDFAEANFDMLLEDNPGKSVAVTFDAETESFGTYVGDDDGEAIETVRQFSTSPWVLVSNTPFHGDLADDLPEETLELVDGVEGELGELAELEDAELPAAVQGALETLEILFAGTDATVMIGNRPYTVGIFDGGKKPVIKTYLIDTGASVSAISEANFKKIMAAGNKLKPAGSKKLKTAGGVKEVKFYKGKMRFLRDKADGKGAELVDCDIPVAVVTSNILGMDQLKKTGTTISFDPSSGNVELKARPKPKPKAKPKGK